MAASIKTEAKRLIDQLPEDSTWDDLVHEIYVRQAIESGLNDSREGRVVSVAEVRAQYGLKP
jgi:Tfp pilus assembly protein PilO